MGLLRKIIAAKAAQKIIEKLDEKGRAPRWQPVPADAPPASPPLRDRVGNNSVLAGAGRVYRENPKLVAGLGVVGALLALHQLTRRRT